MAMRLGELVERYEPGLDLEVKGNVYTVPLASAELGLWCRTNSILAKQAYEAGGGEEAKAEAAEQALEVPDGLTFEQWMLGDVYDKLIADGVEAHFIDFCARTAFIWHAGAPEEQVALFWNSGGDPEAVRPGSRAQKRAAKKQGTGGRRTAAAAKTPKPVSSSGTKSPTASARPRKATGGRRGPKSSGTGG